MKMKEALQKIFLYLSKDEILLRLLHYIPVNANDDPLSRSKANITTLPILEWDAIVKEVLMPSDKKYDLDMSSRICRLCFYTGSRQPQNQYSPTIRRQLDNQYSSIQRYNFDIYVHVDIDLIDQRMTDIADRLNELLLLERVTDVGEFTLEFASLIENTPTGMIGYKLVYSCVSLQESRKREWR